MILRIELRPSRVMKEEKEEMKRGRENDRERET